MQSLSYFQAHLRSRSYTTLWIVSIAVVLFCTALAFSSMLSWASAKKYYNASIMQGCGLLLESTAVSHANTPTQARSSAALQSFSAELASRIERYLEYATHLEDLPLPIKPVVLPVGRDGQVPGNVPLRFEQRRLIDAVSDSAFRLTDENGEHPVNEHSKKNGYFAVARKVEGAHLVGSSDAYIYLFLAEDVVDSVLKEKRRRLFFDYALFMLLGVVCIVLIGHYRNVMRINDPYRLISCIIMLTAGIQMSVSLLQLYRMYEFSMHDAGIKTAVLGGDIKEALQNKFSADESGLASEDVKKYLEGTLDKHPFVKAVTLLDAEDQVQHKAYSAIGSVRLPAGIRKVLKSFLSPDVVHVALEAGGVSKGRMEMLPSLQDAFRKMRMLTWDVATSIVISILFLYECFVLLLRLLDRKIQREQNTEGNDYGIMRPAAFLFLFGVDISISFLPLHMGKLYEPFWGISRDMAMGLPISAEFICAGIGIFGCGVWLDKRGWHEPFLCGAIMAGFGSFYSWAAPDALQLILARGIVGLGYGLTLMAFQGYVISFSGKNKAHGLAELFAGIYAGSICGGAGGAILADMYGYNIVFLVGSVIQFSVVLYGLAFLSRSMRRVQKKAPAEKEAKTAQPAQSAKGGWKSFLCNRSVLGLIFFSSLPASIAVVGFLNYFTPIYLNGLGVSQSGIGRVLMIYGISLVYLGPAIGRIADSSESKKTLVFAGCALGSLTFILFAYLDGFWAAVLGVFFLGLSSSFILSSQSAFLLKMHVTKTFGEGKAIGIFRSSSRIGQGLGPIIFGSLTAFSSLERGMTYFGLAYILTAILFFIATKRDEELTTCEVR